MDIVVFSCDELPAALGALREVALADGARARFDPEQRAVLEELAALHGARADVDGLPRVAPEAVASAIPDPHRRKRLVQLALVTAMADGEVTAAEVDAIEALARALGVREQGVGVLRLVARGHRGLARAAVRRRLVGAFAGEVLRKEGLAGVRRLVGPFFRAGVADRSRALRYKQLGLLPEGTFGRVFWEHCTARGFLFPGESRNAIPERMVFHDLGHVLAEYDTDPAGEIQAGSFQAGFIRRDGFAFLLFVMLQFHLGIQITPVAAPQVGLFEARKVLRAVARGAACKVDLSDRWDFWGVVHLPLGEVRERFGIPPLAAMAARQEAA
ncbi:hypothetical protein ACSRUE_09690 [Sorangium sp. KYC3313]|uniref:hypothetical protein n=1 Tax=Sorangium sp. KYC3313 TaxID=3449740 RepID=UPI003F8C154F